MELQNEGYSIGMSILTSFSSAQSPAGKNKESDIDTSSVHTTGVSLEGTLGFTDLGVNDVDCSLTLGTTKKESKGCPLYLSRSTSSSTTLKPFDYQLQLKLSASPSSVEENFDGEGYAVSSLRNWVSLGSSSARPEQMKTLAVCRGSGKGAQSEESRLFSRLRLPSWFAPEACVTETHVETKKIDHGPSLELQLATSEDRTVELQLARSKDRTVLQQVSYEARLEGPGWSLSNRRLGGTIRRQGTEAGFKTYTRGGDSELPRICAECGTTKTPLWRNGPRGPKTLCNACGIRFKKSGRRGDMAEGPQPATSTTATVKRKLDSKNNPSQQWAEVRTICKKLRLPIIAESNNVCIELPTKAETIYDCNTDQGTSCTTTIQSPTPVEACSSVSSSITTRDFFPGESHVGPCEEVRISSKDDVQQELSHDSPRRMASGNADDEGAVLLMALSCGLLKT